MFVVHKFAGAPANLRARPQIARKNLGVAWIFARQHKLRTRQMFEKDV